MSDESTSSETQDGSHDVVKPGAEQLEIVDVR